MNKQTAYKIILFLAITGVVIDTYSTYQVWLMISDADALLKLVSQFSVAALSGEMSTDTLSAPPDLREKLELLSKVYSITLIMFITWDYVAYFFLVKFKNWARVYVQSIAILYIVACLFDFSWVYLIYGVACLAALVKFKPLFKTRG